MKNSSSTMKFLPLLIAISLIFVIGCGESTDSENIKTTGIWVKMKADARDDGRTRVVVELNVGGEFGTNVVLSGNEYLEVTALGVTKRMVKDTDLFDVDYQVYMDTNVSDTRFQVAFYRTTGENIVDSLICLPTALPGWTTLSHVI